MTKVEAEVVENAPSIEDIEFGKLRVFQNRRIKILLNIVFALIPVIGILYVLGLHQTLGIQLFAEQYIGLFIALVLFAIFMCVPATKRSPKNRVPWYDWILAVLGLIVGLYLLIFYPDIIYSMAYVTTDRFILCIIAILLILEAVRRTLDAVMLIIVSIFLAYGLFASYLPGVFQGSKIPLNNYVNFLYMDPSSMMSMFNLAATIGLVYILFGQVLLSLGGADILNNFAMAMFGRFRGGTAKASVLGSSLVGSITGNPVTNVILTGSVTIPLMKKNGFSSTQAGAVEAVSSTGGQIMPPVMGIAAFIIADTLGVPYAEVALAALVPAILYYLCLFFQVDLIAARQKIKPLSKEQIPALLYVIKSGWLIIPVFVVLIYLLFFKGTTPQAAGLYASAVGVICLSCQKSVWQHFKSWKGISMLLNRIFVDTGKMMLEITIVLAAAGLVMGVTGITGLGFNIGLILASIVQYGLLALLVVSAIICVILGMGMPSVAAYAIVAVLVAPSLVNLGVDPLAAHLFVFYFAIVSNFTPPVAVCCFAAAPIARGNPHRIGFYSMRLGLVAYVVPFLFVYGSEMLLRMKSDTPLLTTVLTIGTALVGCYFISVAVEGYLFRNLNVFQRVFMGLMAFFLLLPLSVWQYSWILNIAGFVLAVLFMLLEWRLSKSERLADASLTQ